MLPTRSWLAAAWLTLFALSAGPARALSIPLDVELDDGISGDFGEVVVEEAVSSGGLEGLAFTITVGSDLGPDADLHNFYFNFLGDPSSLMLVDTNAPTSAYELVAGTPVHGGAGSHFDLGVSFGNGAGPRGNGVLQEATFTLISSDGPLTLADLDLLEPSTTSAGIDLSFAVHVQGTSFTKQSDSETVGALVPEPSTFILASLGLVGLLVHRRNRRRR